jgi:hypothetical protein
MFSNFHTFREIWKYTKLKIWWVDFEHECSPGPEQCSVAEVSRERNVVIHVTHQRARINVESGNSSAAPVGGNTMPISAFSVVRSFH